MFNAITAENRAELVRTQATRWLALNRDVLTAEQISAADAAIAVIKPDLYRLETSPIERQALTKAVVELVSAVFTREQMWHFIGAGAPYIPL